MSKLEELKAKMAAMKKRQATGTSVELPKKEAAQAADEYRTEKTISVNPEKEGVAEDYVECETCENVVHESNIDFHDCGEGTKGKKKTTLSGEGDCPYCGVHFKALGRHVNKCQEKNKTHLKATDELSSEERAQAKADAVLAKYGRLRKKPVEKIDSPESGTSDEAVENTTQSEIVQKTIKKESKVCTHALYIDCIPLDELTISAQVFFDEAARRVAEANDVPHWCALEYGAGIQQVEAVLPEVLEKMHQGDSIFLSSGTTINKMRHVFESFAGGDITIGVR